MAIRYCCNSAVHPGRACGTCGTAYSRLAVTRAASGGYSNGPSLGIDVTDGDPVLNLGDGLGIDLATGELELDLGGFDIPLD